MRQLRRVQFGSQRAARRRHAFDFGNQRDMLVFERTLEVPCGQRRFRTGAHVCEWNAPTPLGYFSVRVCGNVIENHGFQRKDAKAQSRKRDLL
jgi:hypothetical protein